MEFMRFIERGIKEVEVIRVIHTRDSYYGDKKSLLGKPITWIKKEKIKVDDDEFLSGKAIVNDAHFTFFAIMTEMRLRGD